MFSASDRDFMEKAMKIVVESIESKLREPFFLDFKNIAISSISKYIESIKEFENSGVKRDLYLSNDNAAEELIRSHFCDITCMINNDAAYQILDALRYSFSCYAYNGLHQLYTRQENECWHPKIKLTEILTPNDIDSLDQKLTLYRGCDICELETGVYGQAWSTSLSVAQEFAFKHYRSQDWFDIKKRTVLTATYFKEHVLFSNQTQLGEYEVVVDIDKLEDVSECI